MRAAPGAGEPVRTGVPVDKNGTVNEYRWLNPSQPQTLVNATILCYIQAFFGLIGSGGLLALILIAIGQGIGGFGIANEKRWGYGVALGCGVLNVVAWLSSSGSNVFGFPMIISFVFDGAPRRAARPPDEPRLPAHLVPLTPTDDRLSAARG